MFAQVATEAAKGTSHVFLDGGMIMLIVTNLGLIGRDLIKTRKAKKNGGNSQPGKADICLKRGETLVKLETKQETTDKAIDEMKGNILIIVGDVKTLLGRTMKI